MEYKLGGYGKPQPDGVFFSAKDVSPTGTTTLKMDSTPRRQSLPRRTSGSPTQRDFDVIPHELQEDADLFKAYLSDIREIIDRYPLLSAEQEIALGQRIQQGKNEMQKPITKRNQGVILNAGEAKTRLIYSNLRGVLAIALNIWRGVPKGNIHQLMDLVQEGNLELTHTAREYDPKKGYRFSTYAFTNIKLAMKRELARKGYVHVETNKIEKQTTIKKMRSTTALTPEEVSHKLGMEVSKVQELMEIPNITVISFNTPVKGNDMEGEDYLTLGEAIPAVESGFHQAEQEALRNELLMFIRQPELGLTPQEIAALEARMELHIEYGEEPLLREVGRELGVGPERARQLLVSAEKKLKSQSDEAKDVLQEFYDEL